MKIRTYVQVELSETEKLIITGIGHIIGYIGVMLAVTAFGFWLWSWAANTPLVLPNTRKLICILLGIGILGLLPEIFAKVRPYWNLARQEYRRSRNGQGTLFKSAP